MVVKYKVSDVARDFKVSNKDIIKLLEERFGTAKKAVTALTDEELNVIMEHFTRKAEVKSFDEYFAMANKPREEKKERIELISFDSKLQTMIIFASCTCMKTESLPDKIFRASCQSETAMKLPSWIFTSIERQNRVRFAASIPLSEANNEWRLESNRKALPK